MPKGKKLIEQLWQETVAKLQFAKPETFLIGKESQRD